MCSCSQCISICLQQALHGRIYIDRKGDSVASSFERPKTITVSLKSTPSQNEAQKEKEQVRKFLKN